MSNKDFLKVLGYVNNARSRPAREAVQSIKALREQVKMMNDLGYRREQIDKIQYVANEAIQLDLIEANKAELESLRNNLAIVEQAWKRDYENNYSKHSRTIEEARRRYAAMDEKEICGEVDKILNGERPELPAILDELSIAVKASNADKYADLRAAVRERRLLEPWLDSDIAKAISNELNAIESNPKALWLKDESGNSFNLSPEMVDSFLDESESGEVEE